MPMVRGMQGRVTQTRDRDSASLTIDVLAVPYKELRSNARGVSSPPEAPGVQDQAQQSGPRSLLPTERERCRLLRVRAHEPGFEWVGAGLSRYEQPLPRQGSSEMQFSWRRSLGRR